MADKEKKSLEDAEIITERKFGRRSTLGAIGATVLGAAAITGIGAAVRPESAQAQSDSDSGQYADPAGRGRTGVTDNDHGPDSDRGGHGRGRRTGLTDSDSGGNADQAGNGRGRSCSDSDGGRWADPGGRGRRC